MSSKKYSMWYLGFEVEITLCRYRSVVEDSSWRGSQNGEYLQENTWWLFVTNKERQKIWFQFQLTQKLEDRNSEIVHSQVREKQKMIEILSTSTELLISFQNNILNNVLLLLNKFLDMYIPTINFLCWLPKFPQNNLVFRLIFRR